MNWSRDLADVAVLTEVSRTFYTLQIRRLMDLGIEAGHLPVSHLAVRAPSWTEYLHARAGLESSASANVENIWNGRPISKILLNAPIDLGKEAVDLIELIPPFHQRVYTMGLEHVGLVVGADLEQFIEDHLDVLTGRQFQSRTCRPAYRLFDDYTHVKFYERSLQEECVHEGARFDGIAHADWHPADPDDGPCDPGAHHV